MQPLETAEPIIEYSNAYITLDEAKETINRILRAYQIVVPETRLHRFLRYVYQSLSLLRNCLQSNSLHEVEGFLRLDQEGFGDVCE